MKFKVGDQVKFLDEAGGGRVTAIVDDKMVKIETDEGFEMPVMMSELIPDYRQTESQEKPVRTTQPQPSAPAPKEEYTEETVEITPISTWNKPREEAGVYLVFEPHDQQWFLTGPVSVFLVNHTSFDILYSLFLEVEGSVQGVDYGSIPAHSKKILDTVSREELENWSHGILQTLLHEDKPETIYLPVHSQINIRVSRFFKEGSYLSNTLVNGKAIISTLISQKTLQRADNTGKYDAEPQKVKNVPQKKQAFIDKYRTTYGEAIVDLHIGEILDNIAGLSSSDIFRIQVEHFKKALDSALVNDYRKITFIHGIGNGVLKNAIIEYFKQQGNEQADIVKFGVGSLDVLIKDKTE
ncbi:MAG: DUF2027 domain-containing protein [Bacteroidales bacterium]|nr:DUF2027 domain-containing protein [Bacteroidales bacterium]